jgi:hypothetical protein
LAKKYHPDVNKEKELGVKKSIQSNIESNSKPLICIETGEIYIGGAELEKQSEKLFAVKFLQACISSVCIGKKSQYKGYTFKYLKNLTNKEWVNYNIVNKLKELESLYNISDSFLIQRIIKERNGEINEYFKNDISSR